MAIERVGVVGCGLMGRGIAQVCAQAGHTTVVSEINDELLAAGMASVERFLAKGVEKGKISEDAMQSTLDNLTGTTDLESFAGCDLVIEAATENREMKLEIFRSLDEICGQEAIFGSNTSSLNITELAVATGRPDRVVGLHFFNPVPLMKLVEVVSTMLVDESVVGEVKAFGEGLGKVVVVARDRTGFIVNRLLVPYLLGAIRVLDEGLATMEDIDQAMNRLAKIDSQTSQVVELRFFGGLTVEQTAQVMGISPRTVKQEWRIARAWLQQEIGELGQ